MTFYVSVRLINNEKIQSYILKKGAQKATLKVINNNNLNKQNKSPNRESKIQLFEQPL